jgi:ribonuclease HI
MERSDVDNPHLIYGDGACTGNPGPGGWGTVVRTRGGAVVELGGADGETTNNRMEMTAIIRGLEELEGLDGPIEVRTDSTYLMNGITKWIHGWRKNQWKTKEGTPVANQDLWQKLDAIITQRQSRYGRSASIHWTAILGHAGIPGNERCDEIAVAFSQGTSVSLFSGTAEEYLLAMGIDLDNNTPNMALREKTKKKKSSSIKGGYYLSLVAGVARRHKTWAECESYVKGASGAKFKKVASADDETAVLASWGATIKD